MKPINRILSLLLALLMMAAAAITVNRAIFGHCFDEDASHVTAPTASEAIEHFGDTLTVIHTAGLEGTIDGYAGAVPVDIYLSKGVIRDVKALPNDESPSFFARASTILSSWTGKTPAEAAGMKVDAASGATYSSEAIISNVDAGLEHYLGATGSAGATMPWKVWVALAVTLAACILPLFVKNKVYHNIQLAANVIVLGFWCGMFLDYSLMLRYMSSGFVLPVGLVAIAMLIAAFVYPLFGRHQHYCAHICPLGSAQQLVAEVCGHKIHMSARLIKGLDWFRRILWAALMLLLWTDCLTGWMDLELF